MKWREVVESPRPAEIAFIFVLLIGLPLYLMFRLHSAPEAEGSTARRAERRIEAGPPTGGEIPFPVEDIDPSGSLRVTAEEPLRIAYSSKRNIFDFFRKTPPPRPRMTPPPTPVPTPVNVADAGIDKGPPTPAPTPPPPPIEGFKYIGLITTTREKVAVLRKDESLYLGGEEEVILVKAKAKKDGDSKNPDDSEPESKAPDKEYRIVEISPEKIVMGYPGLDYRQVIEFEEVKSEDSKDDKRKTKRRRR